ncbi:MAG: CAP domain-containing protein [Elusimicrobia bacterium]|nr:CAP domain-containing protein [Elusimicrobiota bacterium]
MTRAAAVAAAFLLAAACSKKAEPAPATDRAMPYEVKHEPAAGEPQDDILEPDDAWFRADLEREVFEGTNKERARAGVLPVVQDGEAAKAARYQSRCLSKHGLIGHDTIPCGSLRGRLDAFNIPYLGAENLDFIDLPNVPLSQIQLRGKLIAQPGGPPPERVIGQAIVEDWMNSPHHRDNLLSKDVTDLGVGVYWKGGRVYATQVFLKRTECGVGGQLCCPTPSGGRYCYAPYACDQPSDVCKREPRPNKE